MRGSLWPRWVVALAVGVGLLIPAATARADVVDSATAPSIRSITYNVCGGYTPCQSGLDTPSWVNAMKSEITAWDSDAVMLQELCIGQWAALRSALPGYSAVWTSTTTTDGCAKWDANGDKRFGLGVFVKAPSVDRYAANLTVPTGQEPRAVLCARGPVDGRTTLVCATHLAQYIQPDNGSSQVMARIDGWASGLPVILGADMNESPGSPALDPIRNGLPGTGPFAEADENDTDYFTQACLDAGVSSCRSGEPTIAGGKKFDDIFLTARDFHTVRADAIEPGLSDHKLLRGAAYAETRSPSGVPGDLTNDGRPDMAAVKDDGNLRLYSGLGDGQVGGYRQIGTGGWTDALIAHRGDWTGDGHEDLLARIGDNLWIYPNTGSGALGNRIALGGRPTGWSGVTAILAPGDFDRDGHPDLIAGDAQGLWLYRGDPVNPSGVLGSAPIRLGGSEWAQLDPLAPGDVTGDGAVDLWARDRTSGALRLYPNTGGGSLGQPQPVDGGSWTATDRPLLASAGDANRDGRPDLWATTNAGTDSSLLFHPGTAGGLGTATTVGVGGWQWILRMA